MRIIKALLLTTLACSPAINVPDAATDAAADDATEDSTTDGPRADASDAGADADAPFDAGPCGLAFVDGGVCNALTASGGIIAPTCVATSAPTPVGGPVYNGEYVLTSVVYYDVPGPCSTATAQVNWSICGSDWETVQVSGQSTVRVNATAMTTSPALTLMLTCPNGGTSNWHYDATSTGIVFYLPEPGADGGMGVRRHLREDVSVGVA